MRSTDVGYFCRGGKRKETLHRMILFSTSTEYIYNPEKVKVSYRPINLTHVRLKSTSRYRNQYLLMINNSEAITEVCVQATHTSRHTQHGEL